METGETIGMLDLIIQGAFCVKKNIITQVNQPAKTHLINEGTNIFTLLKTGYEEYQEFTDGCLYLTLSIAGQPCSASVTKVNGDDIFILEQDTDQAELQAMALAACELRGPLSNVMTIADHLFPMVDREADPATQRQLAQINRGLFQMLRVISNMSDAARYISEAGYKQEQKDICALLNEIFTQAGALILHGGLRLQYTGLDGPLYCLVDAEKIERAVYNMLSNALKFSPKGSTIAAKLTHRGRKLYLSVQDSGSGIAPSLRGSVHSRFQRQPALEDGRFGIGLGMVLIRATAAAHGGTVLIDHPNGYGTRITMSIALRQSSQATFCSNIMRIDYAGERNHGLIELSDVLPSELYESENIN